ncbi:MAG: hypothetical protein COB93_10395 [Sneathiella sp.]|nr:MAG: hypothetical protein COB93_10395 [Sneathiella sp.]
MDKNDPRDDNAEKAESVAKTGLVMDLDEEEIVDLDALFDALNIAAKDAPDALEFVLTGNDGGGVLTVSGQALGLDTLPSAPDNIDIQTADLLKAGIVSDES